MNLYLNYILYISYILSATISFISTFVTKHVFDSGKEFCTVSMLAHSARICSLSLP